MNVLTSYCPAHLLLLSSNERERWRERNGREEGRKEVEEGKESEREREGGEQSMSTREGKKWRETDCQAALHAQPIAKQKVGGA